MSDKSLVGQNYTPPDLVAKVTGRAKYAEDYRADGMLFTKLLLSPMPHARVRSIDTRAALAMPGVKALLTADDADLRRRACATNVPLYSGRASRSGGGRRTYGRRAIERINLDPRRCCP
jgi:CO/xanthine dehydrogenase Mo-binding subunit